MLFVILLHTNLYTEALWYVFDVITINSIIMRLRNLPQLFHFYFNYWANKLFECVLGILFYCFPQLTFGWILNKLVLKMNEFLRKQGVHNNNSNNITNDDNVLDIYAAIYYIPFTCKIVSKRSSYLFLSILSSPCQSIFNC
jgi:hypothetical protein